MRKTLMLQKGKLRQTVPDILAVAVLAGFLAFFYWDFLAGRCFIWDDTLTEFYPGVNYFAKSIRAGRFPLWFTGVRDGMPFYSDPQMAIFYPPQWLLIPLVRDGRLPFLVYQRYIVLHYILGGVFMYAFLKHLKLSPIAALSGALVFSLSGFSSLRIVNFVMIQVYVWLPLQLLCVHHLTSGKSRLAWLGLVGAALMSLLAGHQQTTLYCWYLILAYWLYRCSCMRRQESLTWGVIVRQVAVRDAPKLVGTFVLVFGLSAVMVLPAAENWLRTGRSRQSFGVVADNSLPYHGLLMLFVPNFFGTVESAGSPVAFWGFDAYSQNVRRTAPVNAGPGYWQYWEFGAYVGPIFWLALFLILFNWQRVTDKRTVGFFLTVWFGAIWFMLGRYGGLFNLAYHLLPGTAMFRGAAKMTCVATLAAVILTAYAVNLMQQRVTRLRLWPLLLPVVAYVCLLSALFFGGERLAEGLQNSDRLTWARRETFYALGVTVVCAVAITSAVRARARWMEITSLGVVVIISFLDFHHAYGSFQRGHVSPDDCFPKTDRLLPLLRDYREQRGPFRFGQIIRGRIGEELTTLRNMPYFHDFLEVPEGYTSFLLDAVESFQGITNEEAKIAIQNIRVAMERDESGKDWLSTRTNSLPRAKFFARIHCYDFRIALWEALERGEIDWHNEAAVCGPFVATASHLTERNSVTGSDDEVQLISKTPGSYSVRYNVNKPGIIFVSQAFYPGWVTTGGRTKVVEVFGAFQGLVIPHAGRGQIDVNFSPPILRLSLAISLFSVVTAIALVMFGRSRRKSESH